MSCDLPPPRLEMVVENFTLLFWVFVLFELFFQHGAGASKSYKPTIDPTPAVLHVGGGGGAFIHRAPGLWRKSGASRSIPASEPFPTTVGQLVSLKLRLSPKFLQMEKSWVLNVQNFFAFGKSVFFCLFLSVRLSVSI